MVSNSYARRLRCFKPTQAAAANCFNHSYIKIRFKRRSSSMSSDSLGYHSRCSFGPKTKAAVVAFQKSAGLVADGVFGAKSRAQWMANNGVGAVSFLPPGCTSASGFSSVTGGACYAVYPSTLPAVALQPLGIALRLRPMARLVKRRACQQVALQPLVSVQRLAPTARQA